MEVLKERLFTELGEGLREQTTDSGAQKSSNGWKFFNPKTGRARIGTGVEEAQ